MRENAPMIYLQTYTWFLVQGLRFIIQSEKEPAHLDSRVEAFLQGFEVCIFNITIIMFSKQ